MVRLGRERLEGAVEVDEAYLGGAEAGVSGRELVRKCLIAVAVELDGEDVEVRQANWPSTGGGSPLS